MSIDLNTIFVAIAALAFAGGLIFRTRLAWAALRAKRQFKKTWQFAPGDGQTAPPSIHDSLVADLLGMRFERFGEIVMTAGSASSESFRLWLFSGPSRTELATITSEAKRPFVWFTTFFKNRTSLDTRWVKSVRRPALVAELSGYTEMIAGARPEDAFHAHRAQAARMAKTNGRAQLILDIDEIAAQLAHGQETYALPANEIRIREGFTALAKILSLGLAVIGIEVMFFVPDTPENRLLRLAGWLIFNAGIFWWLVGRFILDGLFNHGEAWKESRTRRREDQAG